MAPLCFALQVQDERVPGLMLQRDVKLATYYSWVCLLPGELYLECT